jgi:hypothetical protein
VVAVLLVLAPFAAEGVVASGGLAAASILGAALVLVWAFVTGRQSTTTTFWIGAEGWTITRVRGMSTDRSHGVERLTASVLGEPTAPELVLWAADREVITIGDGLSRAELRFIAEQIEKAAAGGAADRGGSSSA